MDDLIANVLSQSGVSGALVAACLLLSFNLLFGLVKFLWGMKEKNDRLSKKGIENLASAMERNTKAIEHLDTRIKSFEQTMAEFPKFKLDMRRLYLAVKAVAGDKWPKIREDMMRDTEL